jgi:hypothetical protein
MVLADFALLVGAQKVATFALSAPIVSATERTLVTPKSVKEV